MVARRARTPRLVAAIGCVTLLAAGGFALREVTEEPAAETPGVAARPDGSARPADPPDEEQQGPPRGAEMPEPSPSRADLPAEQPHDDDRALEAQPNGETPSSERLVDGFPRALRPVGDSLVEASSLSPAGQRTQVMLVATTGRSPDDVLREYRRRLTRPGLKEVRTRAVAGSRSLGFRGDRHSVVITVRPEGLRTSYTVYGVVEDAGD